MRYSKYNIFSKIRDSENFFITNLLSGNADILNEDDVKRLEAIRKGNSGTDPEFEGELADKGYLSEETDEAKLYRSRYLDFIDSRDKDEIQIFFVTNYSCNFACTYCYQDQYNNPHLELNNEIIDAFFSYVLKEFAGRKKYITIFGGEPLLPGKKQKDLISYILKKSLESNLEISIQIYSKQVKSERFR
jgi:uncharacterized protein